MSPARHLFTAWEEVARAIRAAQHLALFTDFDGTLARIQRRPEDVRLSKRVRAKLAEIAGDSTLVGVASGRSVADLRARVGLRDIWYIGEHGFHVCAPGNREFELWTRREGKRMQELRRILVPRLRGVRGLRIEPKRTAIAIHYRGATARCTARARRLLNAVLANSGGVSLLRGKKVWEILPNDQVTKWTAIRLAIRRARRGKLPLLIYLGDDSTDEHVFARMHGLSVVVGRRRTAARYHVDSPAQVEEFLELLGEIRR